MSTESQQKRTGGQGDPTCTLRHGACQLHWGIVGCHALALAATMAGIQEDQTAAGCAEIKHCCDTTAPATPAVAPLVRLPAPYHQPHAPYFFSACVMRGNEAVAIPGNSQYRHPMKGMCTTTAHRAQACGGGRHRPVLTTTEFCAAGL